MTGTDGKGVRKQLTNANQLELPLTHAPTWDEYIEARQIECRRFWRANADRHALKTKQKLARPAEKLR